MVFAVKLIWCLTSGLQYIAAILHSEAADKKNNYAIFTVTGSRSDICTFYRLSKIRCLKAAIEILPKGTLNVLLGHYNEVQVKSDEGFSSSLKYTFGISFVSSPHRSVGEEKFSVHSFNELFPDPVAVLSTFLPLPPTTISSP